MSIAPPTLENWNPSPRNDAVEIHYGDYKYNKLMTARRRSQRSGRNCQTGPVLVVLDALFWKSRLERWVVIVGRIPLRGPERLSEVATD